MFAWVQNINSQYAKTLIHVNHVVEFENLQSLIFDVYLYIYPLMRNFPKWWNKLDDIFYIICCKILKVCLTILGY